jgi:hypothetical protein
MADNWVLYDSRVMNHIFEPEMRECIRILRGSCKDHKELDFPDEPDTEKGAEVRRKLIRKINRKHAIGAGNKKNWTKVRCLYDDLGEKIKIVIVYHMLKHRGKKWSVSIGFDLTVAELPEPKDPPGALIQEYKKWAKKICNQLKADLTDTTVLDATSLLSIDNQSNDTESVTALRSTRIGELMYTCENDVYTKTLFTIVERGLKPIVAGFGYPGETQMRVTEYKLV